MALSMVTNTEEGDTAPTSGIRPRQPDKYYGQRDFLLLGNWIFSVDQYFILTDMPIHKQGPFISTLLRDEALLWYRANYENWDPAVQLTWPTLRHAMHEYFAPPNEDRRLQDEWANLKQFGTVFEYISILTALAMQIPGLSQTQILELKSSYEIQRHLKKHIDWRTVLMELYTALRVQPSLLKTIIDIPQCQLQVMENQCRSIH